MSVVPAILSASAVIFADEIVKRITVALLARNPTRRTLRGGVLVASRTIMPYNKEVTEILAKVMPIVSRTNGPSV